MDNRISLHLCLVACLLWSCEAIGDLSDSTRGAVDSPGDSEPSADSIADGEANEDTGVSNGELSVLTYNVAGLPGFLSGSDPARNTPTISPLLNSHELVLVQEDFWYHDSLAADATHAYLSDPMVPRPTLVRIGDGLNRFSTFPFRELTRIAWVRCNGYITADSDCLAPKGFSVAVTELAPVAIVYVYNLHMDAGGNDGDITARERQAEQLAEDIAARAGSHAVIVAGDTNLRESRPGDMTTLDRFLSTAGLSDVCRILACDDGRIDRIMFRSSASLTLEPLAWDTPDEFVDSDGADLSDHEPVAARFRWQGGE